MNPITPSLLDALCAHSLKYRKGRVLPTTVFCRCPIRDEIIQLPAFFSQPELYGKPLSYYDPRVDYTPNIMDALCAAECNLKRGHIPVDMIYRREVTPASPTPSRFCDMIYKISKRKGIHIESPAPAPKVSLLKDLEQASGIGI